METCAFIRSSHHENFWLLGPRLKPQFGQFILKLGLESHQVLLRGLVTGLLWREPQAPELIEVPFSGIAVREGHLSAYKRAGTGDLVHSDRDAAIRGWSRRLRSRRVSAWPGGRSLWSALLGGLARGRGEADFSRLRIFLIARLQLQVVQEETDFHIGQRKAKFRRQPALDLRQRETFPDPGLYLFLLLGIKIHAKALNKTQNAEPLSRDIVQLNSRLARN